MRIVHFSYDWHATGGIANFLRLMAAAQAAEGHDVLMVHSGGPVPDGVHGTVTLLGIDGSLRPCSDETRYVPAVLDAVRDFRPDVAHFHASNNFAVENAVRATVPTLKTLHSLVMCPTGSKYHHATGQRCTFETGVMCVPRQAYLRCTLSKRPTVWWNQYAHATRANRHHRTYRQLIVASKYVRQVAMDNGFDGDRIEVVPYFTELPADVPPVSTRNVMYIGRIGREKGADLILEAMARVTGDWRVVIVGEGWDADFVRQRAAELGLQDRVTFSGWLTGAALEAVHRDAAVVVVPSRLPEPFGVAGIESMARERPVVAFDTGGIPDWLENGIGGFLVPPGDVAAMAARIQELLDDPAAARAVGARGRARVMRDFSAQAYLRRLQPIYDRVIAHGS